MTNYFSYNLTLFFRSIPVGQGLPLLTIHFVLHKYAVIQLIYGYKV